MKENLFYFLQKKCQYPLREERERAAGEETVTAKTKGKGVGRGGGGVLTHKGGEHFYGRRATDSARKF